MDAAQLAQSKAGLAFARKLYIAALIAQTPKSLPELQSATGMPRRTLQDAISAFGDIGITCSFVQTEGGRNNQGSYQIDHWGPINSQWAFEHLEQIAALFR